MVAFSLSHAVPLAGNLNQPGKFLSWGIFDISVANLIVIAVMVVIFGAALLIPFHPGKVDGAAGAADLDEAGADPAVVAAAAVPGDEGMWTARVRTAAARVLPPRKLLPDRQPAYVASWVYVFGVASLAALGIAIVSGFALALGGPDWWHYNPVGHFVNSTHLWSVELFMALLVIHLWGKFWMAAWRGRRAMTWITGVVAFLASIVECFTGYVSQQNFDSQWIASNGKDALNAMGIGAFFNVMNFGQMLMWHIVLIPIVLVAIIGAHVLLVRVRGVSRPLPARRAAVRGRAARQAAAAADAGPWRGPDTPLRHPEGRHHRHGDRDGPGAGDVRGAVLAGRAAGHRSDLGQDRPGRLRQHRGHRTGRNRRRGQLRTALQQPVRVGAAGRPGQLAETGRDHPARQRRTRLRPRPAIRPRPDQPGPGRRAEPPTPARRPPSSKSGHPPTTPRPPPAPRKSRSTTGT